MIGPQKRPHSLQQIQSQAAQVRREWMSLMGMSESEIASHMKDRPATDLALEEATLYVIRLVRDLP